METIEFYIGINPEDKDLLKQFCQTLNSGSGLYHVKIVNEFDSVYTYYTYVIRGSWEAYEKFLEGPDFIKSVEHFEE